MGHHEFQKQEGRILTPSFFVLLAFTLLGMGLILVRCVKGIGAVSNMSDGYPWGIWIAYDVATGTAIACGGQPRALPPLLSNHKASPPFFHSSLPSPPSRV